MSDADSNRRILQEYIRASGYVGARDWTHRKPLVPAEVYFARGVNEQAVENIRIVSFGIEAFERLLAEIKRRDDVSDIAVEIDDDFTVGWPLWDYLFVATDKDKDEVARWFAAIPPDLVLPAGQGGPWVRARTIRIEDLTIAPGYQVWALRWDKDDMVD